jgi:hypothetical protein
MLLAALLESPGVRFPRFSIPFALFCGTGEVKVADESGMTSERFEEVARTLTLADRGDVFATTFFAESTLFRTVDLARGLSLSR